MTNYEPDVELEAALQQETAKDCAAARRQGVEHRERDDVDTVDAVEVSGEWLALYGTLPARAYLEGFFDSCPQDPA